MPKINDYQIEDGRKCKLLGWIPTCPKCQGSSEGYYGVKDSNGKPWVLNTCERCGYKFRYEV